MIKNSTPATAAISAMTRSQSRVYRHACFQDPVTHSPASGTTASITSK